MGTISSITSTTATIIGDGSSPSKPAPQYLKAGGSQFEFTQGQNGAPFSSILDQYGTPIFSADSPGSVKSVSNTVLVTSSALGASASFSQAWQDSQALGITVITGTLNTDQPGTLYVDLSNDETNYLTVQAMSISSFQTGILFPLPAVSVASMRYFRFRYVNGSTAQTSMSLYQTQLASLNGLQLPQRPLLSATYSQWTANGSDFYFKGLLSRLAKSRTWIYVNLTNQPTGALYINGYDSQFDISGTGGSTGDSSETFSSINTNNYCFATDSPSAMSASGNSPMRYVTDSMRVGWSTGSTAPTSGKIYVWASELF